jgi:hypothetical protein
MSRAATITAALVFLLTWGLTTHGKYSVTGDEPHYLMVTQSLLADGDIDVANNYQRNDGARFGADGLQPETHVRLTSSGRWLPVGDLGVPILLMPAFAVATRLSGIPDESTLRRFRMNRGLFAYSLISLTLIAMTSVAAALTVRALERAGATPREAAVIVAVAWLSPPVLSHAFLVFPEPFALFVTACVVLACTREGRPWGWPESATIVMLGCLPWVHRKFAFYVLALLGVLIWRRRRDVQPLPRLAKGLLAAAFVVPPLLLMAWSVHEWGNLGGGLARSGLPLSMTGVMEGIPALLVDRENGLMWWAPVYLLLPAALWMRREEAWMWIVAAIALLVPGTAHQWWAGFSPAGRFLVPLVPIACLMALPIARGGVLRATACALLVPQAILTAYAWQHPRLLWPQGDGENRVLAILLPPLGRVYRAIPSFRTAADEAWPATLVILLIVAALNLVMIVGYASSGNRRST